ncbi:MAG: HAD hydrolase-like protein [Lachnospiraceae bacterium]|nr:HAD hydrolase-like protein [Lachnospiraceae bacterium]
MQLTPSEAIKKYILFDLDGTLTDPKLGICTCVQYALRSFGIEEPDLDQLECFIGPPLQGSFMKYYGFDEEKAARAVAKYRERFSVQGLFENEVYRGIPGMLKELKAGGLKLGVASSKPQEFVERILEHFHLRKYFDSVAGSRMDDPSESKEISVRRALEGFGGKPDPSQVLLVGDRCYDTEGAHALGIECVGVTYGYGSMEELLEAKTDYIVRSVKELHAFLGRESDALSEEATAIAAAKARATGRAGFGPVWTYLYLFLGFVVIRGLVQYFLGFLLSLSAGMMPPGLRGAIFELDADLAPVAFGGDTTVILGGLGFLGGGAFLWKSARRWIRRGANRRRLLHLKPEPATSYLFLAFLTIGATIGLNLLMMLSGILENAEGYQQVAAEQYGCHFAVGLMVYGFITPAMEELLFRGIFHNSMQRWFSLRIAILVTAVIFAFYHGNVVQGGYAFLMGLLLSYVYEYFGSFLVPLAVHAGSNLVSYGMTAVIGQNPKLVNWPLALASLLVAVITLTVLVFRKPKVF